MPAWTPADLGSKVVGWWDASDSSTLTLSGSAVSAWASKVGGISASQATAANQPVYSATARNSLPGVTFDGSNDYLDISSIAGFPVSDATGSLFVVGYGNNNTTAIVALGYGNHSLRTGRYMQRASGGAVSASTVGEGQNLGSWQNADRIALGRFEAPAGDDEVGLKLDGGTETTNTLTVETISTATNRGRIGANAAATAASFWAGTIQCAIVISGQLTTSEIEQLEGWAAHTFGLTSLLPSGHPYKSTAPTTGTTDHAFTPTGVVGGTPTAGQPAATQDHGLAPTGVNAAATVGQPALGQNHHFPMGETPTVLLRFDGLNNATSTADESPNAWPVIFDGAAKLSSGWAAAGGTSLLLDGTGDRARIADNALLSPQASDFTIRAKVRMAVLGDFTVAAKWSSTVSQAEFYFSWDATNLVFGFYDPTNTFRSVTFAWSPAALTVYDLAVERFGNLFTLFIDGVPVASATLAFTIRRVAGQDLRIGGRNHGTTLMELNGNIDEFEMYMKALYQGLAFTPPAAAGGLKGVVSSSVVGSPTLSQQHAFTVTGVHADPTVGQPAITQDHALAPAGVSSGGTTGSPVFAEGSIPTPPPSDRLYGLIVNPGRLKAS